MANVKRIEALADCIGFLNDVHNPESLAYQLRNPGLCRAYSFRQLSAVDKNGYRIFTSLIGGYRFLVQDLEWKCSGQTRAKGETGKLKPTSLLTDLLRSFRLYQTFVGDDGSVVVPNESISNLMQAVKFLNDALQTEEVTATTELKFFLEGE